MTEKGVVEGWIALRVWDKNDRGSNDFLKCMTVPKPNNHIK